MSKEYQWKQKIFQKQPLILLNNQKVGEINYDGFFHNIINIQLGEYHYQFKKKGTFNPIVDIINLNNNNKVGTIKFHPWMTKVTIRINNNEFIYKQINSWKGIWGLYLNDIKVISSKGKMYSGTIRDYYENKELVVITLFIRDYLSKQMMIVS